MLKEIIIIKRRENKRNGSVFKGKTNIAVGFSYVTKLEIYLAWKQTFFFRKSTFYADMFEKNIRRVKWISEKSQGKFDTIIKERT